jgi:hypothetical protein
VPPTLHWVFCLQVLCPWGTAAGLIGLVLGMLGSCRAAGGA